MLADPWEPCSLVQCSNCSKFVVRDQFIFHHRLCTTISLPPNGFQPIPPNTATVLQKFTEPSQMTTINLDRMCGVSVNGIPCKRRLGCSQHAVGQKKLVQGRSKPFQQLLRLEKKVLIYYFVI